MLKTALVLLISLSSIQAFASLRDGCFAMFRGNATNGVLCISGTHEESISGEGINFMFFAAGQAKWCGKNAALQTRFSKDGSSIAKYTFSPKAGLKYFLVTFPSRNKQGPAEGKIRMVGAQKTDFDYIEINQRTQSNAGIGKAWTSPKCRQGLISSVSSYGRHTSGWMAPQDVFRLGGVPMGEPVTFKLKNGTQVTGLMMPILSRDSFTIKVNGQSKTFPLSTIKAVRF